MVFNRRMALGAGAAAVAGLAALSWRRGAPARRIGFEPGTLHRGNVAEPGTLDPAYGFGAQEEEIMGDLFTGLIASDPAARPIPGIAERWTTSPDGLHWTFYLRDAPWSDGTPVTAEDFIFAWRRLLDPKTAAPYASFLYVVKNAAAINAGKMATGMLGISAPDPHRLEIALEHPAPYLLEMLTHMSTYPLPRHAVQAHGKDWIKPGNLLSNGAFLLTEWVANDHVTLLRNPRFYDAQEVALKKVIYYPTDDFSAALKRMRAGELDVQTRFPAQEIDWIRANIPQVLSPLPQSFVEMIVINHQRKPFDDRRVRRAVSLAINREVITDKIRRVGDKPAYNLVPPGIANFPGGNQLDFRNLPYKARLAQAQQLMRQAGFGPDRRAKTSYMIRSTTAGTYRAAAAAIQEMLALIFIDAPIIANDFAVFNHAIQAHDFDISEPGWSADFNDAQTFLQLFRTGDGNNWGQYSNAKFDTLMTASEQQTDLTARGRILAEAEAVLLEDQAVVPLFFWIDPEIAWPYVKGWVPNPIAYHRSRWIVIDEKARAAQFAT